MTEEEFLNRWMLERDFYLAWGSFIQKTIIDRLVEKFPDLSKDIFFKIPPIPREKTYRSLIDKAFHRNKPYSDAYIEIEDKVGLRFVVLLTSDIVKIQNVIQNESLWHASLDKDYESEKSLKPSVFEYQSKHFVLKAAQAIEIGAVTIPPGTPCEIQLRTILQHAHSELTHDNIYKRDPNSEISKNVERIVAKSMALIEVVDDYFVLAVNELEGAKALETEALRVLISVFKENIGIPSSIERSNSIVIAHYRQFITNDFDKKVRHFCASNKFIFENIKGRATNRHIYKQPWIILAYYLAAEHPNSFAANWPFDIEEIRSLYVDLGLRYPDQM